MTQPKLKAISQLLELSPIVAFVGVWWWSGEPIAATTALVIATAIQALLMLTLRIPINKIHKFTFAGIFTLVYWVFSLILIGDHFTNKNFLQRLFESLLEANPDMYIQLTDNGWTKLNFVFILSFLIIGIVNFYVTLYMDFDAWVNFKIAISVISFIFFPAVFIFLHVRKKIF